VEANEVKEIKEVKEWKRRGISAIRKEEREKYKSEKV